MILSDKDGDVISTSPRKKTECSQDKTSLNSHLWVAVYVLLPAAVACSHSEVSPELNCVQCVSPPQPVTQGTGRLSPANLPLEKGAGKKKHKAGFSLSSRPFFHAQTLQPEAEAAMM